VIELRWLVSPRNDVDRVLQFREGVPVCGIPDCPTCSKKYLAGGWQEIPVVVAPVYGGNPAAGEQGEKK
jgi:hypothetical protein